MLHQYDELQRRIDLINKQDRLDGYFAPFLFMLMVIAALFVAESVYDGYKSNQDHAAMSSMVAACANGKTVQFGDAVMKCEVRQMVASNE